MMPRKRRTRIEVAREKAEIARLTLTEAAAKASLATYRMAETNRFTRDWKKIKRSADASIIPDAEAIQSRARQLVRDDAVASSAIRAWQRNVVGRGVTVTANRIGDDGNADTEFNAAADAWWYRWSLRAKYVDRERRRDFRMICRWAVAELKIVGEAILIIGIDPKRGPNEPGVMIQCIESEQLDQTVQEWTDEAGTTRQVRGGVEVDERGAAIAYHLYAQPPGDLRGAAPVASVRVMAESATNVVIHYFDPERARQTRGVSSFAPVGMRIRNASEYDSTQLVTARAESCIGFLTRTAQPGAGFGAPTESDGESTSESSSESTDTGTTRTVEAEINPLMIGRLTEGEEVIPFTPTRPGNLYEPFMRAQDRKIAAGLGLSYEQITRDFTNGTFSSLRQSLLEDRREFQHEQEHLVWAIVMPIWEWVTQDGILRGAIPAPGFANAPERYLDANYRPDGWQWIDPDAEIKAAKAAIALGISNKDEACGNAGKDWREVARQKKVEMDYYAVLGLEWDDDEKPEPEVVDAEQLSRARDEERSSLAMQRVTVLVEALRRG